MLIELESFVEVGDDWFKHDPRRREDTICQPVVINTEYVGWVRRYEFGPFDWSEVHMVDRGGVFRITKTYEEMKALLKVGATSRAA